MRTGPHHRRAAGPRRQPARHRHGAVGVSHCRHWRTARGAGPVGHRQGRRALPDSRDEGRRRCAQALREGDRARSASACSRPSLASLDEGAMPIVLGGDHSLAAGSVAAAAVHVRKQKQAARLDLGGRARRHEQPGLDRIGQRARHAARGAARPRAGGAGALRRRRAGGAGRSTPCWSASATSTSVEKEIVARVEGARVHDEGHRSARHRRGHGTRALPSPAAAPAASTSRSTSMSAIRRRARRRHAGQGRPQTTARRTS